MPAKGLYVSGLQEAGKSSGPLRKMALSFLEKDFGGIVFCVKPDEADIWKNYAKETGREKDLIFLSKRYFNFLSYEQQRPGAGAGEIENIVNLFMEVAAVGKDKRSTVVSEEYWIDAVKQFLRNAVTLLLMTEKQLTLQNLKKIIDTAPRSMKDVDIGDGYCCERIHELIADEKTEEYDFELLYGYFMGEFAQLDNRTRSNVISSFTVIADSFLRGQMKRCFCSEKIDFTPEMIAGGKILIVDYNIKEWQKLGSYASAVIKFCFMKAIERRPDSGKLNVRPVFIFADECQNFAIPYDYMFQTTARSSRVITVYGTQNLGNLQAAYGQEEVSSLLGNLGTKIFCQNGDDKTNVWSSESIGKVIVKRRNASLAEGQNSGGKGGEINKSESLNEGWSEQKDFLVDPIVFTELAKGSDQNHCNIEFILWQSGRILTNHKSFLKTHVKQECRLTCGAKQKYHCYRKKKTKDPNRKTLFRFKEILQSIICAVAFLCSSYGYYLITYQKDFVIVSILDSSIVLTLGACLLWTLTFGIFEAIELFLKIIMSSKEGNKTDKRPKEVLNKSFDSEIFLFYVIGSTVAAYKLYCEISYEGNVVWLILFWFIGAFVAKLIMFVKGKKGILQ